MKPIVKLITIWNDSEAMIYYGHASIIAHPFPRFSSINPFLTEDSLPTGKIADIGDESRSDLATELDVKFLRLPRRRKSHAKRQAACVTCDLKACPIVFEH